MEDQKVEKEGEEAGVRKSFIKEEETEDVRVWSWEASGSEGRRRWDKWPWAVKDEGRGVWSRGLTTEDTEASAPDGD